MRSSHQGCETSRWYLLAIGFAIGIRITRFCCASLNCALCSKTRVDSRWLITHARTKRHPFLELQTLLHHTHLTRLKEKLRPFYTRNRNCKNSSSIFKALDHQMEFAEDAVEVLGASILNPYTLTIQVMEVCATVLSLVSQVGTYVRLKIL